MKTYRSNLAIGVLYCLRGKEVIIPINLLYSQHIEYKGKVDLFVQVTCITADGKFKTFSDFESNLDECK